MGKQGELMEQMAKAQRDRKKRELEEKLRASGDLPPAEDAPKVRFKKPARSAKDSDRPFRPQHELHMYRLYYVVAVKGVGGRVQLLTCDLAVTPVFPIGSKIAKNYAWSCFVPHGLLCLRRFGDGPHSSLHTRKRGTYNRVGGDQQPPCSANPASLKNKTTSLVKSTLPPPPSTHLQ